MNEREFGGYLPLELPRGQEHFGSGPDVLRMNCGRSAIYAALADARPAKIFLPWYNCDTVAATVKKFGVPFEFYRLDDDFLPTAPPLAAGEWLLYVPYFGACRPETVREVKQRYGRVIFDNTQSFFAPPHTDADSYNVYSCRKFFGTSDGAYLVHTGLRPQTYPQDESWQRSAYLMRCIDESTNAAYAESLQNEAQFAEEPRAMSNFTRRLLQSVDYADVQARRKANFDRLHARLGGHSGYAVWAGTDTPMFYPFYYEDPDLRGRLVKNRVYVCQMWKYLLDLLPADSVEARFSRFLLPLPVDQRYTPADMDALADLVESLL